MAPQWRARIASHLCTSSCFRHRRLTTMPPKATAASPAANRAAALAAAEARLRGSPPNDPTSPPPKPVEPVWLQPSEKQDHESKKTLTRMLDRGIIRDNGYEQSAECVQVSGQPTSRDSIFRTRRRLPSSSAPCMIVFCETDYPYLLHCLVLFIATMSGT